MTNLLKNYFDIDNYARKTYNAVNALYSTPNTGIMRTVDTLTQIMADVIDVKYYTTPFALTDYVKIDTSIGAYSNQVFQYTVADVGSSFKECIINPSGSGMNQDGVADIDVDGFTVKNNFYRQKYSITQEGLKMAANNMVQFNLIEQKERARLKTWQLGFQANIFEGLNDGRTFGLLNQPEVTVNTTLLPATFDTLTVEQLKTFVLGLVNTYNALTNYTIRPNRLLMPTSAFTALGVPPSNDFPFGSIREYIENAFKGAGAPDDFKIVHAAYGEEAGESGGNRFVLYNTDPDNVLVYNPLPYTPHPLYAVGALDMTSDAEGQFTGVRLGRPESMLYIDAPAANA